MAALGTDTLVVQKDFIAGVAGVAGAVADGPHGALGERVGFGDVARVAVRVLVGFGSVRC